jgi:nucleotide-binding universal stress UspA family protein
MLNLKVPDRLWQAPSSGHVGNFSIHCPNGPARTSYSQAPYARGLEYGREEMTRQTDRSGSHIVVGVNGGAASVGAVWWAVREARMRQASVHLIFACDHDQRSRAPYAGQSGASQADEDDAPGTALRAAEQQASQTLPPGRLSSELAAGPPARVLIERSAGADLLVLGTAYPPSQPASAPAAMGPVARACLHSAACPVVVVGLYPVEIARRRAYSAAPAGDQTAEAALGSRIEGRTDRLWRPRRQNVSRS